MKHLKVLMYFDWLRLKADNKIKLFAFIILAAGIYGIYTGNKEINLQKQLLRNLDNLYQQNIAEMKVKFPGEMDAGDIGYYHAVFAKHLSDSWAPLALGQRDVYPSYLKLRLLALQNQLYNSENTNPDKLATGSFDLSFVLIFLLPLFIIALSFNIISEEREQGTLMTLLSNPVSLAKIIQAKLLLRFIIVLFLVLSLMFPAILWSGARIDERILLWLGAVILYILFWLGVSFAISFFYNSTTFNAIALLSIWLLLTIVAPALINVVIQYKKPAPEGIELTLKQREEVHSGWDRPKDETLKRFFIRYPQFSNTSQVKGRFSWKWYYAFQDLGDQSVEDLSLLYHQKLVERQEYAFKLSAFSPPAILQETLTAMAATDLTQHLAFLESAKIYHQKLKAFYYPYLFNETAFIPADFKSEPQHTYKAVPDLAKAKSGVFALLIACIIIYGFATILFFTSTTHLK